ncbi:hypothetical protein N0V90_001849 [Kalmusia sp. IMI 367209]|nr:hypothetical protein N0V90_001849 [Kalmusia sp. IMI 367209]
MYFSSASEPAAPDSNSNYTESVFLPYVHDFGTGGVPLVNLTIHAGEEDVHIEMPVDTGSTGLLIGAPLLPGIDPHAGTRGRQYLSSSHIVYVGRYLDLSLTFHGQKGAYAETTVPVLIVDKSWNCPWYDPSKHGFECPLGPEGQEPIERDVSSITYMGVGFGRNKNADGQRTALPEGNPFLNIQAVNGKPVGPMDLKAGYIVSTKGIQLGLTKENTRKFNFMNLDCGITHAQDPRDWAMPRMRFYINGRKSIPGFALIDTGIPQMYIRAEDSMPIPEVVIKNPKEGGSPTVHRVRNGTRIAIEFGTVVGSEMGDVVADYEIEEPPPYVNTGRNFLRGYTIAFDAVDGRLGFVETWKAMM